MFALSSINKMLSFLINSIEAFSTLFLFDYRIHNDLTHISFLLTITSQFLIYFRLHKTHIRCSASKDGTKVLELQGEF